MDIEPSPSAGAYLNVALGLWLLLSAFLWQHGDPAYRNTWTVGLLIVMASTWGLRSLAGRFCNTVLALWLLLSTLLIPHITPVTLWNNAFVACTVLVLSIVSKSMGSGQA